MSLAAWRATAVSDVRVPVSHFARRAQSRLGFYPALHVAWILQLFSPLETLCDWKATGVLLFLLDELPVAGDSSQWWVYQSKDMDTSYLSHDVLSL